MSSTTVHIPDETLERIDAIARRRGLSRNRIVVEALQDVIDRDVGQWPDGFWDPPADQSVLIELSEGTRELERTVVAARRNRGAMLL